MNEADNQRAKTASRCESRASIFGFCPRNPLVTIEQLQSAKLRRVRSFSALLIQPEERLLIWVRPDNNTRYGFAEKNMVGDGWCLFHAADCEPIAALDELTASLDKIELRQKLADPIYNDLHSGELTPEDFADYLDANGNKIREQLERFLGQCAEMESNTLSENNSVVNNFKNYIVQPEVQRAYLNHIKEKGYANLSLIKAYLDLKNKKLFLLQVNTNGLLTALSPPEVSPENPNTLCVVYRPSPTGYLSHYNKLVLVECKPVEVNTQNDGCTESSVETHPIQI